MSRLAVDFSQYGGGLNTGTVSCWQQQGVELAIVQYSSFMRPHLTALETAGMKAEGYVYLYWNVSPWNQTPQERTRNVLNMAGNRISRLWLDCEDSSHPFDPAQLDECIAICQAAGMPTGIYTGRWWWVPQTGNSNRYSDLPLWHAEYRTPEGQPASIIVPDLSGFQPYGGWQSPAIWQYQNTSQLCGHSVDMNAILEEPEAGGPPVTPEEELELADRRATAILIEALNWDVSQGGHGMYRAVSRTENNGMLLLELCKPDRTSYDEPVMIWIPKPQS